MANQLPLKVVVVGHVDHGKSSLIGRILYETKSVPLDKVNKLKDKKGDIEYAFLLDALEEEQRQGITIDTTQIRFHVKNREILIIDAPGHREFLKNMVSGAAGADIAILIIDAKEGVAEQSLRHAQLLSLIGITEVLVVVNKLDLVSFSETVFTKIKKELQVILNQLNLKDLDWIPVSAKTGHNINDLSIPWYQGPNTLDFLYKVKSEDKNSDKLRLQVQSVFKLSDQRLFFTKVISGVLKKGQRIRIYPSGELSTIDSIYDWSNEVYEISEAKSGTSATITLKDDLFLERGNIIISEDDSIHKSKNVQVNFFNFSKNTLYEGNRFLLKIGTDECYCELSKIHSIIDSKDLKNKNSRYIEPFDTAKLDLILDNEIVFDLSNNIHKTSRFVLLRGNEVIGGGIISRESGKLIYQSGIQLQDREKLNGHKSAIVSIDKDLKDFGFELEKLLFKNGIRAIYLETSHDLIIEYLLKTGHVIILDENLKLKHKNARISY